MVWVTLGHTSSLMFRFSKVETQWCYPWTSLSFLFLLPLPPPPPPPPKKRQEDVYYIQYWMAWCQEYCIFTTLSVQFVLISLIIVPVHHMVTPLPECVRLRIPKIILRTHPWTERHKTRHMHTLWFWLYPTWPCLLLWAYQTEITWNDTWAKTNPRTWDESQLATLFPVGMSFIISGAMLVMSTCIYMISSLWRSLPSQKGGMCM